MGTEDGRVMDAGIGLGRRNNIVACRIQTIKQRRLVTEPQGARCLTT